MIKNDKGFALTEILILSAVVIGVLTFMYIQFKTINRSYQKSFKYDTPEGLYLANNILNYINDDNFDILVEKLLLSPDGYIDITNCDINIYNTSSFCEKLYEKEGIEQIIFTSENPSRIIDNNNLDADMKEFIKQIKTINTETDYRIIIKYTNGTFATMRFNKGNAYVQNGMIVYLDAINNTGEGHSNNIDIWKDLSGKNNDATLYNSPIWNNNSIIFDGESDCGRIENTIDKTFENGVTLETRTRVLSRKGATQTGTLELLNNYNTSGFGIRNNSEGKYGSAIHTNNNWYDALSNNVSELGEYHTLATTYDNNNLKMYIDGELVKTTNINQNTQVTTSNIPVGIGCNIIPPSTNYYANVEFQNVLIYDRALSESEIQRNYHADIARY